MKKFGLLVISAIALAAAGIYFTNQGSKDIIPDHVHTIFSEW